MNNSNFKLGYHDIDKQTTFKNNDLIILASTPSYISKIFALNCMKRNPKTNGCLLELQSMPFESENIISKINKAYRLTEKLEALGIENYNGIINTLSIELPTILQLLEKITEHKDNYDYFIINSLSYIRPYSNLFFDKEKNYEIILQYLQLIAKAINKPIVLIATYSIKTETEKLFYYGCREKYCNYIFTLHNTTENIFAEKDTYVFSVVKSPKPLIDNEFTFEYDFKNHILNCV